MSQRNHERTVGNEGFGMTLTKAKACEWSADSARPVNGSRRRRGSTPSRNG
jgi:hypothetical protein